MKILYVKNNSERAKNLQLKTIIYEKDGQRFVKKQALVKEAIPHLKKMKESYEKLTASIIDPKIKLAKIINESENSLTFEFIDGISLEKKFYDAIKLGDHAINTLIKEYIQILKTGFKTTKFDSSTAINDQFRKTFGHNDYTKFDGELSFHDISNIDLIFSNIIFKDNNIYLIDYEWIFEFNIPINFIIFRQFENFIFPDNIRKNIYEILNITISKNIFTNMNKNFIMNYITNDQAFYQYADNYKKYNPNYLQLIQNKENHIQNLISTMGEDLNYARSIVELRDQQLYEKDLFYNEKLQSMRLKNRIKRLIKKIIPKKILQLLGYSKDNAQEDQPISIIQKDSSVYTYKHLKSAIEIEEEISNFKQRPLISIIMPVYNVDPKWLDLAIQSIENQWYDNWELCIADDKSTNESIIQYLKNIKNPKIKVRFLDENLNISGASNAALEIAKGDYIVLMDNDDEITPDALYEMVKVINEKDAEFIYSDEDFISTEGVHSNPHFKPDFSPDLLLSHNYITHLTCFKKELLDKVGHFNPKFDGAQDYDLFLRLTEQTSKIHHIQVLSFHSKINQNS
jgi:hypothetical protein